MNKSRSVGLHSQIVALTSIFWAMCESAISGEPATPAALDILEIAADCRHDHGRPYNLVDRECFDRLTKHFDPKPIWKMADMFYYIAVVNVDYSGQVINRRAGYLNFSDADYLHRDVPTWRDIFDGREGERHRIVERVFSDNTCRGLAERGGIQPELAERCQARDLFKYASHLDSCLTGFRRNRELLNPERKDGKLTFDENMEEIRRRDAPGYEWEHPKFAPMPEITESSITEFAMHSSWIAAQCASLPGTAFDGELRPVAAARGNASVFDIDEYATIVGDMKKGHDAALGISARAGDPWAIRSYYPPHPKKDPAYWTALRETNPLLVHRWMASAVGGTMLSAEERLWHAVKAYAMERERFANLDLEEYVGEYLILDAKLDQLLADEAGQSPDDAKALADKAVARVADGELLKYPWVSPPRRTP